MFIKIHVLSNVSWGVDDMKDVLFRKVLVVGITLLFIGVVFIPTIYGGLSCKSFETLNIDVSTNGENIEIHYQINKFIKEPVKIGQEEYFRILLDGESNILLRGMPDIPNICRSIIILDTAKMNIQVTGSTFEEYEDVLIAPSKGNLPRMVNPDEIPFVFDKIYSVDDWFPGKLAELQEPYIVRDFRGEVVKIYPFQYNPVKKILRFYTDIKVEISPDGVDTINCIYRDSLPAKIDIDFNQIYKRRFINYNLVFNNRYDPVEERGNMLVITYDDFWDNMTPFIEWKTIKGVPIEMVKVSTIGGANDIKTYIEEYYNTNGLTFVLLVGDVAQIPTLYVSYYASDPSYSYIVGDDHYPDLFVGRFSAENIEQLETQVERTIKYEKFPQDGTEWYHKGTGVASNLGPGDDGEYDNQHMDNIRTDLLAYTYTEVDQIYAPSATAQMVTDALNGGRGIVNYCGHGSMTSWGTTGFSNYDVDALVNDNMLPFIISVACYNGMFDGGTCFAEAWMRATHDGEPTGSIANFMSAKSQEWSPPMDAQDEFIDILVETYEDNKKTTFGALCFNGCMHMNDEYGYLGWAETDAWTVFGDPSLQVRTNTPSDMTVIHGSVIEEGSTSFDVTVTDIEGALCAISRGLVPLGYAYTDENGHATIEFEEPITGEEPVDLVITAYNKVPYYAELPTLINIEPEAPTIDGPHWVIGGIEYEYTFVSIDPNEHNVTYIVNWGYTGGYSYGPYPSGETITVKHTWDRIGRFTIRAMAKDTLGAESNWSEFKVTVPIKGLSSNSNMQLFGNLIQRIFSRTTNS